MEEPLRTALLAQAGAHPEDAAALAQLVDYYARAEPADCDAIRAFLAGEPRLRAALQRFPRGDREQDARGWLRRSLALLALCDGWPDPRDAFLEAQWLCLFAHSLGAEEEVAEIRRRATPRCAEELFSGKRTLNQLRWTPG